MKTVIRLDVPEFQIGQPVTVFFKDTMEKHGVCEEEHGQRTLKRLRETMEDMVRGNASEEVSYLLRLMDKWESN